MRTTYMADRRFDCISALQSAFYLRTNKHAYEHAPSITDRRPLGVFIMNFPGEELVYRFIGSNFKPQTQCAAKTYRVQSAGTWAEFRLPNSRSGLVLKIKQGSYSKNKKITQVFSGLCDRVRWTDLTFSCGLNGKWSHKEGR